MKILKNNGLVEEFDATKVKTSIENSTNDIGLPLTEADLNMLLQEISKKLYKSNYNNHIPSSNELRRIIYYVLIDRGFPKTAQSYMDVDI